MFGLSLSKILFTIFVVVAVWKGFALVTRLANERRANALGKRRAATTGRAGTIELVECSKCGAYFDPRQGCRCGYRHG